MMMMRVFVGNRILSESLAALLRVEHDCEVLITGDNLDALGFGDAGYAIYEVTIILSREKVDEVISVIQSHGVPLRNIEID